jgi:NitT/TauT family transport system permease protein
MLTTAFAPSLVDDPSTKKLVAQTLRRRSRRRRNELLLGIGVPLLLLALWEVLVWGGVIDRRFFPAPSTIWRSGIEILMEPGELASLGRDILATLQRLAIGYALGAVTGVAFGVFMGLYPSLRAGFAPTIYATFPTPKLAVFPLLLVIFGIGDSSKIALVTLGVFYMTCINTLSGVLYANPIYRDMAQAFRLPMFTTWTKVVVPSALPAIIAGLKLALGQALILVVAAEFVAANTGIGQFIWNSWQLLDIAKMFLGLVVTAFIGVCAMMFGNFLERRFIPWSNH